MDLYNEKLLKREEKAIFSLRALYKQYGYLPFKMSKFEEYDLYVRNKDFLVCDNVITFNDTDGKLLALKPDVTLSIIKNTVDEEGCKQKVYYSENVYRVSASTHQFKEIMQTGLECIGDIDVSDMFEVVYLAAKSLAGVSEDFVIDISHMGILAPLIDDASDDEIFKKEIVELIGEKNKHEILNLCKKHNVESDKAEKLLLLSELYGKSEIVLPKLSNICNTEKSRAAYQEFSKLCELLQTTEFADRIRVDFSVINNMSYYNGVVFKGFLNGICESVLSGGRYDSLMRRIGRKSSAIGFAVYVDLLEGFGEQREDYDVDTLLLYSDKTSPELVTSVRESYILMGKSVTAQRKIPAKLRYREIVDLDKE